MRCEHIDYFYLDRWSEGRYGQLVPPAGTPANGWAESGGLSSVVENNQSRPSSGVTNRNGDFPDPVSVQIARYGSDSLHHIPIWQTCDPNNLHRWLGTYQSDTPGLDPVS